MTAPWTGSRSALLSHLREDQGERGRRGDRLTVEHSLAQHPELAQDAALIVDLVEAEVRLRLEAAETPTLEEYVRRFPRHEEALGRLFATRGRPGSPVTTPEEAGPGDGARLPPGLAPPGYDLVSELGRGGMGVVYQARQHGLERLVALKMVRWGGQASDQEVARFRTEAEAVGRLAHPHVVQVYAFGEHQGQPYYVMELLAGSLAGRLRHGPLPVRQAAE